MNQVLEEEEARKEITKQKNGVQGPNAKNEVLLELCYNIVLLSMQSHGVRQGLPKLKLVELCYSMKMYYIVALQVVLGIALI